MKASIKYLLVILFAVGMHSTAFAQNSDNASVNANARVIAQIAVTGDVALDFGDLVQGTTEAVNVDGTGNDTDAVIGEFTVTGGPSASVSLEFTTLPATLGSTTGGADTLPTDFNSLEYAGYNDGALTKFNPAAGPTSTSLDGSGNLTVLIGGSVDATGVTPDSYQGSITLTASYN